jgi:alpha/beta superfamily hydrolase
MKHFSENHFLIPAHHGQLELMVAANDSAKTAAIICHPHSQLGGTMNNKVVTTVVRAWQELNFNTIRFNFRSVGESTGEFDHGEGEQEDLATVIAWAQAQFKPEKIILAGFSFGAFVALKFCQTYQPDALLLIAPPSQYPDFHSLHIPATKNFLIAAGDDEVVSTPDILQWAEAESEGFQEIFVVTAASHFFHGKLLLLRDFLLQLIWY